MAASSAVRRRILSERQPSGFSIGHRFGGETLLRIPADQLLRCLRDQMIVEPLETIHSRYIIVANRDKPMRGIVKAVGPGHYPLKYDHQEKHKRTKVMASTHFVPTEVKVGDVVELGGAQYGGYAFEQFWWGDVLHLHCREADVCFVREDMTAEEARRDASARSAA
jgi:hypothetical protein